MPSVMLNYPRRLRIHGKTFEKGSKVYVTQEDAKAFVNDPRFDVTDLSERAAAAVGKRPPTVRGQLGELKKAIEKLEEGCEDSWLPDGRPNRFALEAIVGWAVSPDLRDDAIALVVDKEPTPEDAEKTAAKTPAGKSKIKISKVGAKAKAAAEPIDTGAGAETGDDQNDGGDEDAVEVN